MTSVSLGSKLPRSVVPHMQWWPCLQARFDCLAPAVHVPKCGASGNSYLRLRGGRRGSWRGKRRELYGFGVGIADGWVSASCRYVVEEIVATDCDLREGGDSMNRVVRRVSSGTGIVKALRSTMLTMLRCRRLRQRSWT